MCTVSIFAHSLKAFLDYWLLCFLYTVRLCGLVHAIRIANRHIPLKFLSNLRSGWQQHVRGYLNLSCHTRGAEPLRNNTHRGKIHGISPPSLTECLLFLLICSCRWLATINLCYMLACSGESYVPETQCCRSWSGQGSRYESRKIIPDPDLGSPGFEMNLM